jgi:hypothetical protein
VNFLVLKLRFSGCYELSRQSFDVDLDLSVEEDARALEFLHFQIQTLTQKSARS